MKLYMQNFDFSRDALDVSLRKLLLAATLPKETQQIDRVMEAFARRYDTCHTGLLKDPGREPVPDDLLTKMLIPLCNRPRLRNRFLVDDATYRHLQRQQQEQDDERGLCEEYPVGWCAASGVGGELRQIPV